MDALDPLTGRSLPRVTAALRRDHLKREDKWLAVARTAWPSKEESGMHFATKPLLSRIESHADREHDISYHAEEFTESVHAGGELVSFDERLDDLHMIHDTENASAHQSPLVGSMGSPDPSGSGGNRRMTSPVPPPRTPTRSAPAGALRRNSSFADGLHYSLFVVLDGHNGHEAAEYFMLTIRKLLHARLPRMHAAPKRDSPDFAIFLKEIRVALLRTISTAERNFAAAGLLSGTTVTIGLLVNWVLTIVNIGDSSAFIDTGDQVTRITVDHNVGTNEDEFKRLESAGVALAKLHPSLTRIVRPGETGVGPVRVWPGGLTLSRAFGDFDAPQEVSCAPLVVQMALPARGARIIMASDGLWAMLNEDEAVRSIGNVRALAPNKAAEVLVRHGKSSWGLKDDVTVIVVDVVPSDVDDFGMLFIKRKPGLFACGSPNVVELNPALSRLSTKLEFLHTCDYGLPNAKDAHAQSLHESLVMSKKVNALVWARAKDLKKKRINPLQDEQIREMCRKVTF